MKLIFLHTDKYYCFLQVNFNTLGIKVSYKVMLSLLMGMIKHAQNTQSNKFAMFLQCLKKKLGMELIFCMQINIKVSTSWHDSFWQKWPDISKVPKIRKECHNCFCVAKYSDVLWVSGHVLCYLLYNFLWYNFEKLKLVSAIFYQFFIFSPNDSPLKTMKNVFYFI